MRLLDLTLPTAAENLALDEALLLRAEAGEAARCCASGNSRPAVVLGAGCRLADDVDEAACGPTAYRSCAVPAAAAPSCWGGVCSTAWCSIPNGRRNWPASARRMPISWAAWPRADGAAAGISDLAAAGRKFSGNAQQRKRRYLLHHGTLLYAFDLAQVAPVLPPPPRQPEYRAGREHAAFLHNVDLSAEEIKRRLRVASAAGRWKRNGRRNGAALVAEKYAQKSG